MYLHTWIKSINKQVRGILIIEQKILVPWNLNILPVQIPFISNSLCQKPRISAWWKPIDLVVRAHDAGGVAFLHTHLKRNIERLYHVLLSWLSATYTQCRWLVSTYGFVWNLICLRCTYKVFNPFEYFCLELIHITCKREVLLLQHKFF